MGRHSGFFLIIVMACCLTLVSGSSLAADSPGSNAAQGHAAGGHDAGEITGMDHGSMDHGDMDHGDMDHGDMDHAAMEGHSGASDPDNHGSTDQGHDHTKMVMEAEKQDTGLANQVKIEERLGAYIDFKARFKDSQGRDVDLKTIFDKPVVLLPVYFMCTSVCNFLQAELANALNQVNRMPGEAFNVITLSFADDEGPDVAHTSKRNYANLIQRDFPLENWYYLTGDTENIRRLTDSLGYFFVKKKKHFYIHPSALVVLARDGKIIRYLYGPNFLPFDLGMALNEAERGEPGISIKRGVLSFCFDYDPANKTYVFKMFRITGTAILMLLAGFVLFLLLPSKRKRKHRAR